MFLFQSGAVMVLIQKRFMCEHHHLSIDSGLLNCNTPICLQLAMHGVEHPHAGLTGS